MKSVPTSSSIVRPSTLAIDRQAPALVVILQDTLLAQLLLNHEILGTEVLDHLLLLLIDPAGQSGQYKLPRLQEEGHDARRFVRDNSAGLGGKEGLSIGRNGSNVQVRNCRQLANLRAG
jgi:hypothetical protein